MNGDYMKKRIDKIKKILHKRKEDIIFDLFIEKYDFSNFYIAFLFNNVIGKFKILYVPLDIIELDSQIEEYFCYQFVLSHEVDSFLTLFRQLENSSYSLSNSSSFSNILFHTYPPLMERVYSFHQCIDSSYAEFFEIVVLLFQHLPNIMSDLSRNMLVSFNSKHQVYPYNDLICDNYSFLDTDLSVPFLEKVGNKYYAVVNHNKFLLENKNSYWYVYSGKCDSKGVEVSAIIRDIQQKHFHDFYRIHYYDDGEDYYFLCYDIDFSKELFLIHNNLINKDITFKDLVQKKLKIVSMDSSLLQKIYSYLMEKYHSDRAQEIVSYSFPENYEKK